jgi:hypothetical protein
MKLNMVNGKSVGEFRNQDTEGSVSNRNSHNRTNVSLYRVCLFYPTFTKLDNKEHFCKTLQYSFSLKSFR